MIRNPIFKGFNPDPCICRKGEDYYAAVSTFEWMPGIPVYHTKDMKHWELYTHVLTDDTNPDLKKLPSAKGIWAPCLTYCEKEDLFYVVYGVMNSMNARFFEVDNFLITAKDIRGPWSAPVYLHSAGFDASILHDDDGRKWVVSLEWETREGYEKPGAICLCEYSPKEKRVIGYPKRIYTGGTDRGCIEAPHLTKHNGLYYLMCAEGGTGYNHCVTMARAENVWGPYTPDPENPIMTAVPGVSNERHDDDHLKPRYFNPESVLQKVGHGSYVETVLGEVYLLHLCSRPFVPELRCTLGRETGIQKMQWTEDGWLRAFDGDRLAKEYVEESKLPDFPVPQIPSFDDFIPNTIDRGANTLGNFYYAPRILPQRFADVKARPGWVRLRGQESLTSLNRVSLLARKLTSVYCTIETKMEFSPEIYQHSAGLVLYYDNMNFLFLRETYSEKIGQNVLSVLCLENGVRTETPPEDTPVPAGAVYLKAEIEGREVRFYWCTEQNDFKQIGGVYDMTHLSDEYCKYGEFTGTFVGLACEDRMLHEKTADFDYFSYDADETRGVN